MSKIGRNAPCPSGAGVKFKLCLRKHPELSAQSTPALVWWICGRWQSSEPSLESLMEAWRHLQAPDPAKFDLFLERVFAAPLTSVDWSELLRGCAHRRYRDLPGLYRRVTQVLREVKGQQAAMLQSVAAEVFRTAKPEQYGEILDATLALDPVNTPEANLRHIVDWASSQNCQDDLERLRQRFSDFPEYMLDEDEDEAEDDDGDSSATPSIEEQEPDNPQFSQEIESRIDEIWERFNAEDPPTPEAAETLVEDLLALPHEATTWSDVLGVVRETGHPKVFAVFERVMNAVTHSSSDFSFLCWGAMEEAAKRGETERLPAIAREFLRVSASGFDPDSLSHIVDYLLGYHFADECLEVLEKVYPLLCEHEDLMGWVVSETASEILNLRLGYLLAAEEFPFLNPEEVVKILVKDIEAEMNEQIIARLVHRLLDPAPQPPSRKDFQLPLATQTVEEREEAWIAIQVAFAEVARDYAQSGNAHPARTLSGLQLIYGAALQWRGSPRGKGNKRPINLLAYIDAKCIERQVLTECRDLIGINAPRYLTMLEAHLAFARWASRHALMSPDEVDRTEQEVLNLLDILAAAHGAD